MHDAFFQDFAIDDAERIYQAFIAIRDFLDGLLNSNTSSTLRNNLILKALSDICKF